MPKRIDIRIANGNAGVLAPPRLPPHPPRISVSLALTRFDSQEAFQK